MLHFFRKYQRYFFLFITILIVISFSFFGTYGAMQTTELTDPEAFINVRGQSVKRSELEQMTAFLSTYRDDFHLYRGAWGPNFLNDGTFQREFLDTGLLIEIALQFKQELQEEYENRLAREKRYSPYTHPTVQFISAEALWQARAPQMTLLLKKLQSMEDPLSREALSTRVQLFLAEKQFPSTFTKSYLTRQQDQLKWVPKDPVLYQSSLALFDYNTIEDWFGAKIIRLMAQYILNAAAIAEENGYSVTKDEAYIDLLRNAEIAFQSHKNEPNLYARNSIEYLNRQLNRMRLDRTQATTLWQKVLLFRRLFDDAEGLGLLAPETFAAYNAYTAEELIFDLYQIDPSLRLGNFYELQQLQTYLNNTAKDPETIDKAPEMLTVDVVRKKAPELVKKDYQLKLQTLPIQHLLAKISVQNIWDWKTKEENWVLLEKEFPDLGKSEAVTPQERFNALEKLDPITRQRTDRFAGESIIAAHPEWIPQGLDQEKVETVELHVPIAGKTPPLSGVTDRDAFIALLDQAPLKDPSYVKLNPFIPSREYAYRIEVLKKDEAPKIMTFQEAKELDAVDPLLHKKLQKKYERVREQNPEIYKNKDGSWKPLPEVQEKIAEQLFDPILSRLKKEAPKYMKEKTPRNDRLASIRFAPYLEIAKKTLINNPSEFKEHYLEKQSQWTLNKEVYTLERSKEHPQVNPEIAFSLKIGDVTSLITPANGDLSFAKLNEKREDNLWLGLFKKIHNAKKPLGRELQLSLGLELLKKMEQKKALRILQSDQGEAS